MTDRQASRCAWAESDPLNIAYHDEEWGRPVQEEPRLFEMLTLEGAQSGLSWLTILRKREGYRKAFAGFDPQRVAGFDASTVDRLLADASIVRHRGKIESTINNARRVLALWEQSTSLRELVWAAVGGAPRINHWSSLAEIPASTEASRTLSNSLKAQGFRFVGPTTCYAFMQAAGLVNDHLTGCFLHPANQSSASASRR